MSPAILSQEEIDALLGSLPEDEEPLKPAEQSSERSVKVYDFRHPDKLSRDQLRTIEMVHDNFARRISTDLSTFLRSIAVVNLTSVEQQNFDQFLHKIPSPAILFVVALDPLPGVCVLELHPNVAFIIIDRLLGGSGRGLAKTRELSEVEHTLLQPVIASALDSLKDSWSVVLPLMPRIRQTASTPQFLHVVSGCEVVLTTTFEFKLMDNVSRMRLCIPYVMLEPIVQQLTAQARFAVNRRTLDAIQDASLRQHLGRISVSLAANLGSTDVSVNELLHLEPGDCIRLGAATAHDLDITVAGELKFRGKVGLVGKKLAMRITEVVDDQEESEDDAE